jgi:flagellar biosynthesis chaperone FliJ
MVVRRVLQRLLRLRELEEEQSRLALEVAVLNRHRLAEELAAAADRQAFGRMTFVAAIPDGDTAGRTGGLFEMERASKERPRLEARLAAADAEVTRQREALLALRTARRQVEALVTEESAALQEEAARREQRMLDDWYSRRSPMQADRFAPEGISRLDPAEDTPGEVSI